MNSTLRTCQTPFCGTSQIELFVARSSVEHLRYDDRRLSTHLTMMMMKKLLSLLVAALAFASAQAFAGYTPVFQQSTQVRKGWI
jgi:hypothetical protein